MGRPKKNTDDEFKEDECQCDFCKNESKDFSLKTGEVDPVRLIEAAKRAGVFVYDLETEGFDPRKGRIEGVAFYVPPLNGQEELSAWYCFTDNTFVYYDGKEVFSLRPRMARSETMEALRPIWQLPGVVKITANGKFDHQWLLISPGVEEPVTVVPPNADSMLCDYIADERRRRYGLKQRVKEVFNHKMTTYEEASQRQGQFSFMNAKPLGLYAQQDCYWTYQLHMWALEQILRQDPPRVHKPGKEWTSPLHTTNDPLLYSDLEKIYWEIEMKFRDLIMEMETTGCLIDWEHLVELERRLEAKKLELVTDIINTAGWAPNLRSPKQVSDFLYNSLEDGGLGLPTDGLEQGIDGDYCVVDGTKVETKRGFINIATVLPGDLVRLEDRSYAEVSKRIDKGILPVIKLTTSAGFQLKATTLHRIRVINNNGDYIWRRIGELEKNDKVVIQSQTCADTEEQGLPPLTFLRSAKNKKLKVPKTLGVEVASLLGYLVGDGSFQSKELSVVVSDKDLDVWEWVINSLSRLFNATPSTRHYRGVLEARIGSKSFSNWFKLLDISKKAIFPKLWLSPEPVICGFLRGLFEADGFIGKAGSRQAITWSSLREQLARDVQLLLLRVGIVASLRSQISTNGFLGWHLRVPSAYIDKFKSKIGFIGVRKNTSLSYYCSNSGNSKKLGGFPNLRNKLKELSLKNPIEKRLVWNTLSFNSDITISTALKLKEDYPQTYSKLELNRVVEFGQFFDNVVSIENIDDAFVYDLCIPGPMTYISDGFVSHNSTSTAVIKHFGRKNSLVKKLLLYRSLEVIDRSFCKKLIKIAQEETRVRTGFNQTGTKTGRISSSRPINLMNQPRSKEYSIRKAFCAKLPNESPDLIILDADFSQLELRLVAHASQDPSLLEVYNSGGVCKCDRFLQGYECENPDRNTNCKWEGLIPPDKEKKCPNCGTGAIKWQERCRHTDVHQRTSEDVGVPRNPLSKNLNFGTVYRIGAPKFVATADLYDDEGNPRIQYARELIDKWMDTYWRIPQWHYEVEQKLKKNNWIAYSLTGRRRRLDDEKKFNEYGAVTQAINFEIQGCQIGSSKIMTSDGYMPLDELYSKRKPIFDGKSFTEDYTVYDTGNKYCFKLKLEDGRVITCSADHRFGIMSGLALEWQRVSKLKIGDMIATSDRLMPLGHNLVTNQEAYLMGVLIGDGHYRTKTGFSIACKYSDKNWCNVVKRAIKDVYNVHIGERTHKTNRNGKVKSFIVTSVPFRKKLSNLGLKHVAKKTKIIPDLIFNSNPLVRAKCIAGLFDTDGHIKFHKKTRSGTISFSNRVKQIAYGLHYLLSSLGITSTVKRHFGWCDIVKNGEIVSVMRYQYRVVVLQKDFKKFYDLIPLCHHKKINALKSLNKFFKEAEEPRRSLPPSFMKAVGAVVKASDKFQTRSFDFRHGRSEDADERRLVQTFIAKAVKGEGGDRAVRKMTAYINTTNSFNDVLSLGWSKIASITPVGIKHTYDIEIFSENHGYVSNGILTHNSAADIIKLGMIRVCEERDMIILNSSPEVKKLWKQLKFLIQVHDECLWECPASIADEAMALIKHIFESVAKLRCPLVLSIRKGTNWATSH